MGNSDVEGLKFLVMCEHNVHTIRETIANGRIILYHRQCEYMSLKLSEIIQNIRDLGLQCGGCTVVLKDLYRNLERAKAFVSKCSEEGRLAAALLYQDAHHEFQDILQDILQDIEFCYVIYVTAKLRSEEWDEYFRSKSSMFEPAPVSDILKDQQELRNRVEGLLSELRDFKSLGYTEAEAVRKSSILAYLQVNVNSKQSEVITTQKCQETESLETWGNLRFLGSGAGASVCSTSRMGIPCAIKVFSEPETVPVFLQEAGFKCSRNRKMVKNQIKLHHPHIISSRNIAYRDFKPQNVVMNKLNFQSHELVNLVAKDLIGPAADYHPVGKFMWVSSGSLPNRRNLFDEFAKGELELESEWSKMVIMRNKGDNGDHVDVASKGQVMEVSIQNDGEPARKRNQVTQNWSEHDNPICSTWICDSISSDEAEQLHSDVGSHLLSREENDFDRAGKRISTRHWIAEEIHSMLELMHEAVRVDVGPEIWDYASENLLKRYGFDRASISCEQQWDSLLKSFNTIQEHESKIQNGVSSCVSYWEMSQEQRSKSKLPQAFVTEWCGIVERILAAMSCHEEASSIQMTSHHPSYDLSHGLTQRNDDMTLEGKEMESSMLNDGEPARKRNRVTQNWSEINNPISSIVSMTCDSISSVEPSEHLLSDVGLHLLSGEENDLDRAGKRVSIRHWIAEEIHAMLELMHEAVEVEIGPEIWDYVSENLLKRDGFDRASISCEQQWDSLLKSFNTIQEHESKIQNGVSSCVSYWKMSQEQRSKSKLPQAFVTEWYGILERILAARSCDEEVSSIQMASHLQNSDLSLDQSHLDSADCDGVIFMDDHIEIKEFGAQSEDEELSGDSTATLESQAGIPVNSHLPLRKPTFESDHETNSSRVLRALPHCWNSEDVQPSPPSVENDRGQFKTLSKGAKAEPPPKSPSRKSGSSIYYGVRFRPDLNKWVGEIRVAEWKAIDKKLWLGTFDTEEGAARAVDLACKLLKCKKKRGYNLPCPQLDAYSGSIPSHLVLTDVTTGSMFKAATLFIKRECQAYAASFPDPPKPNKTQLSSHEFDPWRTSKTQRTQRHPWLPQYDVALARAKKSDSCSLARLPLRALALEEAAAMRASQAQI